MADYVKIPWRTFKKIICGWRYDGTAHREECQHDDAKLLGRGDEHAERSFVTACRRDACPIWAKYGGEK